MNRLGKLNPMYWFSYLRGILGGFRDKTTVLAPDINWDSACLSRQRRGFSQEIEALLEERNTSQFKKALKKTLERVGATDEVILLPKDEKAHYTIRICKEGNRNPVATIYYPFSREMGVYYVAGLPGTKKSLAYSKVDPHQLEVVSALIVGAVRNFPTSTNIIKHPKEQLALG